MAAVETLSIPTECIGADHSISKRHTFSGATPLIHRQDAKPLPERLSFDPSKHLRYTPPAKVYTMAELGFSQNRGVSPIGVSEPFPLFSDEAIDQMRAEIFSDEVWSKHQYSSDLAQCQLRGYAQE